MENFQASFVRIAIFLFGGGFRLLLLGFRSPLNHPSVMSRHMHCGTDLPMGSSTGSLGADIYF